jgi:FkbM family methyltransferase
MFQMRLFELASTLTWRVLVKLRNSVRKLSDVQQRRLLKRYADRKQNIFFVQVGSNDAEFGDPIKCYVKEKCWRGIMIEPVPYIFERLRRNYESERIQIMCCAVTEQPGQYPFCSLKQDKDPNLPRWYDQLGSFRKDIILKHSDLIPDLESRIQKINVRGLTYNQVLGELNVKKVDLLHVDTEGYDYIIIRQVKLDASGPEFVLFEHRHMSVSERRELLQLFRKCSYRCLVGTNDIVCIQRDALRRLVSPIFAWAWMLQLGAGRAWGQ